jgi:hypothetical protein
MREIDPQRLQGAGMTLRELEALERDPVGVAPLKVCVQRLCAEVRRLRAELADAREAVRLANRALTPTREKAS